MSLLSMRALASNIDGLYKRVSLASNQRKVDAVLAIENGLTQTTPIDTGAAISNWQVTVDAPATEIIEPYFPSTLGHHDHHAHGDVAGAPYNAAAAMDAARLICEGTRAGQAIYISNPLPYIEKLDVDGTSPQASPGFVDRAIIVGVDAMSRAKLEL